MNIQEEIRRVFELEIRTLEQVRDHADETYTKAVEILFNCAGKVVVTGMGKSGIVARKIASTMISTGTPSVFIHPAEAMHGDVGLVMQEDVVLALSKSGETEELSSILLYAKNIDVPVISITANLESTLAKDSNLVLFTPVDEEACPLDLAPTSSTTAALVVGDALAMTVMRMRGFSHEQFASLHPGGRLGRRLLTKVSDIMRTGENNPVINIDDTVHNMLYEISSKRCGAVSVIDYQDHLVGLVTDFDVRNFLEQDVDMFSRSISEVMNQTPIHILSDEKAVIALNLMENREKPIMVLPVLDKTTTKVIGMIHLHDLISLGL